MSATACRQIAGSVEWLVATSTAGSTPVAISGSRFCTAVQGSTRARFPSITGSHSTQVCHVCFGARFMTNCIRPLANSGCESSRFTQTCSSRLKAPLL